MKGDNLPLNEIKLNELYSTDSKIHDILPKYITNISIDTNI